MAHADSVPGSLRLAGALFFIVGGGLLVLMSYASAAAPSLWYFISFCSFPVIGIVWLWKPRLAAALSIGPLASVAVLLQYFSGMMEFSRIWALALVAGLLAAAALVIVALRGFAGGSCQLLFRVASL